MVIAKRYRLNITDNVSENMQFLFETPMKAKEFVKQYLASTTLKAELWEVTTNWDLATGVISQTQTKLTTL